MGARLTLRLLMALAVLCAATGAARAQSADGHPGWPGTRQLFVGTCYQPVDRTAEQIHRDMP